MNSHIILILWVYCSKYVDMELQNNTFNEPEIHFDITNVTVTSQFMSLKLQMIIILNM